MEKLVGKGARRVLASLFIWLVFMIFLTTAVTQQSVSTRIDKDRLGLGYSGTLALVKEAKAREKELPALRREHAELLKQLTAREQADQEAKGRNNDAWDAAVPILRRLSRVPECDIEFDSAQPVPYGDRAPLWGQAKVCVEERGKDLPPAVVDSFNKSRFPEIRREAVNAGEATAKLRKQVADAAAAIARAATPSPDEAKAIASFRDADVLRSVFLTRWLIDFPPPVLQLLLSASAGAFGALLITLILLVYPQTDLKFSSSGGFWERIMLGGFIAVCVYIVLLGGTAVLGTASFDQGGANYMTFCAISVLAGMFSDRVAHWLSERADLFFKQSAQPPNAAGNSAPPPASNSRRTRGGSS